ncbi:ABC transporter permease [Mycoplasma struthionis]|uniref:ABC transporter permease n=1 Tax=Mycoplasma struthionis TaxID=538220 RepID=A0A3G8LIF1_9MOLU|nr:ABC transporter permease [Mycoplasma struthionis]AZG68660.1 ABC transporter permease [Mycoplasma struthionis]
MRRLFKEVFKSLSRNKVTLVCLTILIFLTTFLFTLLNDVKVSFSSTVNSYDKVSRLHDVTVDLDVNPSGVIPNSGYSQVGKDNVTLTNDPIKFAASKNGSDISYSISIKPEEQNYIKLKNRFENWNIDNDNLYISTEDFMRFYYSQKDPGSSVAFEVQKQNPDPNKIREFTFFGSDRKFKLYKKENNKFVPVTQHISLAQNQTFKLLHEPTLNDIARVAFAPRGANAAQIEKDYLFSPNPLFINIETKEASYATEDYDRWNSQNTLIVIPAEKAIQLLGFRKDGNNDKYYFNKNLNSTSDLQLDSNFSSTDTTLNIRDKIKTNFSLNKYLQNNRIERDIDTFTSLKSATTYKIPEDWIRKTETEVYFNWYRQILNWNNELDEDNSNWKGSYLKFISDFKETNPDEYNKLLYLSYWNKTIVTKYSIGDYAKETLEQTVPITKEDTLTVFKEPWEGGKENPKIKVFHLNLEHQKLNNIKQVEFKEFGSNPISDREFLKISNVNQLKTAQDFISKSATNFARSSIINSLKKEVGEENLGLRQTITVETVNEETGKKNVYHFVNVGNEKNTVLDIKQNVDKLYNETLNPGYLNSSITNENVDKFVLKPDPNDKYIRKIPSVYTKDLIEYTLKQFTPDINYFNADIRFDTYYDYLPNTEIPYPVKGKILAITTATPELKNPKGSTLIGGIAKVKDDQYIILRYSPIKGFVNNNVWNKVKINNKEYLSLNELYDYLVTQNYTVRGEIGPNGWAKVNEEFKNSISLPISFGAINNEFVQEIIQKNSIQSLVQKVRDIILNSDLRKLFNKDDLYRFFEAGSQSVQSNGFHTLLAVGKINGQITTKVLLDILKFIIKPINHSNNKNLEFANTNANTLIKKIFNNIITYLQQQYKNSGTTQQERDDFLLEQIHNISGFLNLNSLYLIPQIKFSIRDALDLIKDKNEIFEFLKSIVNSVDFIKFSAIIQDWYEKHPYKPFTAINDTYWSLSNERILLSLLQSLDEYKIKTAINNLINQLDFSKLLNPDSPRSLYQKWINSNTLVNNVISDNEKAEMRKIFIKLNGSKDGTLSYTNINKGLFEIFSQFNLARFTQSLNKLIKHDNYPISSNNKIFKDFNTESLTKNDYIAAFLSAINSSYDGIVSSGKISQIQAAIIKMFNLSNKTDIASKTLNLAIPAADENKLSLLDIPTLLKLNFPVNETEIKNENNAPQAINEFSIDDVNKILFKVQKAIENKTLINLTLDEYKFLENKVLVTKQDLQNLEIIKQKIEAYKSYIQKLLYVNYLNKNQNYNFSEDNAENIKAASYGDLAYRSAIFNDNAPGHENDSQILKTLHSVLANSFVSSMLGKDPANLIRQSLGVFSLWTKLGYNLNKLANVTEKIIIDSKTDDRYREFHYDKFLTYDQITLVLQELFKVANDNEIKAKMANYNAVINPIPSMGILGSDDTFRAKLLKVAYANAQNTEANKVLVSLISSSPQFSTFFNNLRKANINEKTIEEIKKILLANSNEITYNFGLIASANEMPTYYLESIKTFIDSFIKTSHSASNSLVPLVLNDQDFDILYKNTLEAAQLPSYLSLLNIPRSVVNPLTFMSFPQIALYYLLSPNPNEGNLAYVISKILNNLQNADVNELKNNIAAITQEFNFVSTTFETQNDNAVSLDMSYFNYLVNHVFKNPEGKDLNFFNINISKIAKDYIKSLIEPVVIANQLVYTDSGSYLAKVSYGYLSKNKKEPYTGDISKYLSKPFEMQDFIRNLDDKYKIIVNNQQYLIIGVDNTADYLYPVVNEENIQVDTSNQAIVFVNSKGFDRIYSAYPTFALKTYVLVKAPVDKKGNFIKGKDPKSLKAKFNDIVSTISASQTQKAYLKDEQDPINPERYIRVVTIRSIITSIRNATLYLVLVLSLLVSFIVYFIIKRYIEARNKVIGILRAQGYKSGEIALSFAAFGWLPSTVGAIMGYILGFALQKSAMNVLSSYWTLETVIIPFSTYAMLLTILVPIFFTSGLIFIITRLSVKKKPTELMSGLTEVAIGNLGQRISSLFRRWPIKIRYIAAMALNNFWKMFSLFLAFSTTSLISMFFLSSNNVFNKTISKTYKDRLYKFKLDLESPTTEGGPYVTYNKQDINSLLYVPNDLAGNTGNGGSQLDYDNPNFLRPGESFNTDVIHHKFDPTVITKSSLDLLMDLSVELSPWDITYANMPETQRARVAQIFNRISLEMQNTQQLINLKKLANGDSNYREVNTDYDDYTNIIAVKDLNKFLSDYKANKLEDLSNRTGFFIFLGQQFGAGSSNKDDRISRQFYYIEWDAANATYLKPKRVSTSSFRTQYRDFLVDAYSKLTGNDFFTSFGGVFWNDQTNEKYTYAKTLINGRENRIYGYYDDSEFIKLYNSKGQNLTQKLRAYNYKFDSNDPVPVIVNEVAARRFHLKPGSIFSAKLLNHVDRFAYRALLQEPPKLDYKFRVIDISETYINLEIVSRKDILDHILGYDTLSKRLKDARQYELDNQIALDPENEQKYREIFDRKYDAFNGILSNDDTPVQTIDTLTTYSLLGFWGAAASYDVASASSESIWNFFKRIFISDPSVRYKSVYEHNVEAYNEAHPDANLDYKTQLKKLLDINDEQLAEIVSLKSTNEKYKNLALSTLTKFFGTQPTTIYGKTILNGASFDVNSKDIEASFISGISNTVNTILLAFIIVSLIISIVILVVITNIMIASNQRSIATFSILGYTNKEKVFLFFFNYVPAILFACLLMIPVTLSIIAVFNTFMMVTSQIVLPLILHLSAIVLSTVICLTVFTITSVATWKSLNKIKAVDALKGK